ncbi:MAG: hypothetical protein ACP5VR_08940 [Acidimicrobiales bacterium]
MKPNKPAGLWRQGASGLLAVATMAGLFLVGAGAASASSTGPTPGGTVGVSATLNPDGGAGPQIECAWLVQDLNSAGGLETSNANGSAHDYTGTPGNPPYDTLPTSPGGSTVVNGLQTNTPYHTAIAYTTADPYANLGYPSPIMTAAPCALPSATSESPQQLTDTATPTFASSSVVDVTPLAFNAPDQAWDEHGDTPGLRVELWAAVNDTYGLGQISTVDWNVYYPDGSLDVDVHAGAPIEGSSACTNTPWLGDMFSQAVLDNELTTGAVGGATNGLLFECNEDSVALFHNAFTISKDDPNGIYKIVADARDAQGREGYMTYYLMVNPFIDFAKDFSSDDFGNVLPGVTKTVEGDTTFNPPNSTGPTITNGGNSGMQVGVQFFPLLGGTSNQIGTPDSTGNGYFDASFGYNADFLQTITPIAPASGSPGPSNLDQVQWFHSYGGQEVCPDDTPKLDVSVTPPSGLTAATFTGPMVVWYQSNDVMVSGATATNGTTGYCPTDSGIPYTPVAGDSGTPVRVNGTSVSGG